MVSLVLLWLYCFGNHIIIALENKLVINEINTDDIGGKEFDEFIELKAVHSSGTPRPALRPYILICIKGSQPSNRPAIIFSADLYHATFKSDSSRFFVIGSLSTTLNPDMSFLDPNVYYKNKEAAVAKTPDLFSCGFTKQTAPVEATNVLPDGDDYPLAFILLQDEGRASSTAEREVDSVRLKWRNQRTHRVEQQPFKVITTELEDIIKKYMVDMVIYSRRSQFSQCAIFERICSVLAEKVQANAPNQFCYELMPAREWDVEGRADLSINRCPRSDLETRAPFLFQSWKVGKKTPNANNDCESGTHFLIEDTFPIPTRSLSPVHTGQQMSLVQRTCSSASSSISAQMRGIQPSDAAQRRDEALTRASSDSSRSTGTCPVSPDFEGFGAEDPSGAAFLTAEAAISASTDLRLDELTAMVKQMMAMLEQQQKESPVKKKTRTTETTETQTTVPVEQWKNVFNFMPLWERLIKRHHASHAKTLLNPERKPWLVYLPNEESPENARVRCRFCVDYINRHPTSIQNPPEIMQENGLAIDENIRKYLSRHALSSSTHADAEKEMKTTHERTLDEWVREYQSKINELATAEHEITDKFIRTVYTEVKLNIPFDSHKDLVTTQKKNGINLGVHHYERTSATRAVEVISDSMHDTLVNYIKSNNYPLSIISDTATDPSQKNYLIIYLRTIENDFPRTFFYSLLLVSSEKAVDLLDIINKQLQKDGLEDAFKKRLRGYASDGAAVMRSEGGGLAGLVQAQTQQNVYVIHCMAHRLQLAIGHAMENTFLETEFEKTINAIYSFYNNKATKRKATLRNTAEALDNTFYELNYIFEVRWVASEHKALDRLMKNYEVILENLAHIEASPTSEFDSGVKATASGFRKILLHSRFFITLQFMRDVLAVFKSRSQELQKASAVLIGQEAIRERLITSVQAFASGNGANIQDILDKGQCSSDGATWSKCRQRDLDSNKILYPIGQTKQLFEPALGRNPSVYQSLSEFREEFINKIVEQLNKYFPEGMCNCSANKNKTLNSFR